MCPTMPSMSANARGDSSTRYSIFVFELSPSFSQRHGSSGGQVGHGLLDGLQRGLQLFVARHAHGVAKNVHTHQDVRRALHETIVFVQRPLLFLGEVGNHVRIIPRPCSTPQRSNTHSDALGTDRMRT